MQNNQYTLTSKLWIYPGNSGWHFLTISQKISDDIAKNYHHIKRGFGSVPVTVQIGEIIWQTSIFPDKKSAAYILPVKKPVRKAENLVAGDSVKLTLIIRV